MDAVRADIVPVSSGETGDMVPLRGDKRKLVAMEVLCLNAEADGSLFDYLHCAQPHQLRTGAKDM